MSSPAERLQAVQAWRRSFSLNGIYLVLFLKIVLTVCMQSYDYWSPFGSDFVFTEHAAMATISVEDACLPYCFICSPRFPSVGTRHSVLFTSCGLDRQPASSKWGM
jgi:hypothetical protein